jgi:hypothetical protein
MIGKAFLGRRELDRIEPMFPGQEFDRRRDVNNTLHRNRCTNSE